MESSSRSIKYCPWVARGRCRAGTAKRRITSREVIMAKIKHIAIRTPNPDKTAAFYKEVFGLEEVGRARSGYYLSDGYINLAILQSNDQGSGESPRDVPGYAGIDHLGFLVDEVDASSTNLCEAGSQ